MVLPELPDGAPWGRDDVVGGRTSLANAPWGRDDVVEGRTSLSVRAR
jgi:hypothetical protein